VAISATWESIGIHKLITDSKTTNLTKSVQLQDHPGRYYTLSADSGSSSATNEGLFWATSRRSGETSGCLLSTMRTLKNHS
jgi:hypothetical protein